MKGRNYLVGLPGGNAILVESERISSAASCLSRGRSEDHGEFLDRSNSMSGWSHSKRHIIILVLFDDVGKTSQEPKVAAYYPGMRIHKRIYGGFR